MAKFDHGGGCPCGLSRECNCGKYIPPTEPVMVAKVGGTYVSTKKYGHERGFSCAFRQWRADSHCHYIHGYSLAFEITFECDTLDSRNWCQDFGGLKPVKTFLEDTFDHTLLVAEDDPAFKMLCKLHEEGLADVRIMPMGVGCERIAEFVYWKVVSMLQNDRVRVRSVQVWEHEGNSARYEG